MAKTLSYFIATSLLLSYAAQTWTGEQSLKIAEAGKYILQEHGLRGMHVVRVLQYHFPQAILTYYPNVTKTQGSFLRLEYQPKEATAIEQQLEAIKSKGGLSYSHDDIVCTTICSFRNVATNTKKPKAPKPRHICQGD